MAQRELTGITWNHTRGLLPLLATAQRFMDARPDVTIRWERRSLQAFADFPIERLAESFDLIVIDHPFAGHAGARPVLVPLDAHLPAEFLADQAANSVGASYRSYEAGGHLWALPIDAATPVAAWREDLLARHGRGVPRTWDDLLDLARAGLVALPAIPIDSLMAFFMLGNAFGEDPCATGERVLGPEPGRRALEALRELVRCCDPVCLDRNPIRTYEAMVAGDDIAYCPFAYGYSTYARPDYTAPRPPLRFGDLVELNGARLRSTLGGTGLAITRRCADLALAADYAAYCASPEVQRGLWVATGGQPGHRAAWLDPEADRLTGGYHADTLRALDEAWLRPRHHGYIPFQDEAGHVVHAYLREGGDPLSVLDDLDRLYRQSLPGGPRA